MEQRISFIVNLDTSNIFFTIQKVNINSPLEP